MLQFFRRIVGSRVGVVVTFAGLVLIAVLFGLGDVAGFRGGGSVAAGSLASVGRTDVTTADVRRSVADDFAAAQAQQPTLTMQQFVDGGGVDVSLERAVAALSLETFGHKQGMAISRRAVDGQIASIPTLQGPTGQFDPAIYEQLLRQRHLTDQQIHEDIARQLMAQQLVLPTIGSRDVPAGIIAAYAGLLLEKREGLLGTIPASALPAGPAPTPAELAAFYQRNQGRYVVPERRVIRYALITPDAVKAQSTPSDAEVAAAYQARRADFQPVQKRDVTQVVVLDQAAANALAAKVKAGTSVADAARAAGLSAATLTSQTKAAYAAANSPALADAVFGAAKGAVVGPVRGAVGFVVAHVDQVTDVPGKTLDQARPDLVKTLTQTKGAAAMGRIHDALQDGIGRHANVSELASAQHLPAILSPPLTAAGVDPDHPDVKLDPALGQVVAAAFASEEGDDPQLVQTAADGSFAVVGLDRIVRAAPRPLAQVQAQVAKDFILDRQEQAARKLAAQVLAKINGGTPFAQALSGAGVSLKPAQPVSAMRAQVMGQQQGTPTALKLLFSMRAGTATMLEAPDHAGWLLMRLNKVTPGDPRTEPRAVDATRGQLSRVVGNELGDEFARAVQADVGVKRDPAAFARFKAELLGRGGSDQ